MGEWTADLVPYCFAVLLARVAAYFAEEYLSGLAQVAAGRTPGLLVRVLRRVLRRRPGGRALLPSRGRPPPHASSTAFRLAATEQEDGSFAQTSLGCLSVVFLCYLSVPGVGTAALLVSWRVALLVCVVLGAACSLLGAAAVRTRHLTNPYRRCLDAAGERDDAVNSPGRRDEGVRPPSAGTAGQSRGGRNVASDGLPALTESGDEAAPRARAEGEWGAGRVLGVPYGHEPYARRADLHTGSVARRVAGLGPAACFSQLK